MLLLLYQIQINKVNNSQYFYVKFRNELLQLGVQICPNAFLFVDEFEDRVRSLLKSYEEKWNELTSGDPNLKMQYYILHTDLTEELKQGVRVLLMNELRSLIGRFISAKTTRSLDSALDNFKLFCRKCVDFDMDTVLEPIQKVVNEYVDGNINVQKFGSELLGILAQT